MISKFEYFYKTNSSNIDDILGQRHWNYFISAYTLADRVKNIFEKVQADKKLWINFLEYDFEESDLNYKQTYINFTERKEEEIIKHWKTLGISNENTLCIDSTGFIRPYLAFLLKFLYKEGYKQIDIIYSEPKEYTKKDETVFSKGDITSVRQVRGFEGEYVYGENKNDVLIINSGYDDKLISAVSDNKKNANQYQLIGFPSLRANMYQQGLLRVAKCDTLQQDLKNTAKMILAPANDPFITASILEERINQINSQKKISSLYISPLATKPQLIGIVIYCLIGECPCTPSLIFPFSDFYSKVTGDGIARTWLYRVQFTYGKEVNTIKN